MRTMDTFDEINYRTGFANGEPFTDEAQVRAYFTPANQISMFGDDAVTVEQYLAMWADLVIANRWHCAF